MLGTDEIWNDYRQDEDEDVELEEEYSEIEFILDVLEFWLYKETHPHYFNLEDIEF